MGNKSLEWEEPSYIARLEPSPSVRRVLEILRNYIGDIIAAATIRTAAQRIGRSPSEIGPKELESFVAAIIEDMKMFELDSETEQKLNAIVSSK